MGLGLAGFLSLFSMDVFVEDSGVGEMTLGFVIHMMPVWVMLGILIWGWNRSKLLGMMYLILAVGFGWFFHAYREWSTFLLVVGIPSLIGVLFWYDGWVTGRES